MPPYENFEKEEEDMMVGLMGRLVLPSDDEDAPSNASLFHVPLVGVSVEAEALDFIGEVKLSQSYRNSEEFPIEATYHFPVDEAAAVCEFLAEYEDGTVVKGVVMEKNQARKEYSQAVSEGKQANLLETVRRDIFTLNVGNLPAGGYVKITITYVTALKAQGDAAAFILPTCIAPRYTPREDVVSADESRALAPPTSSIKLFGLDIKVKFTCRSNIKTITCPTHESEPTLLCDIQGKTGHFKLSNISMDRDLVVLVAEERCHQPRVSIEKNGDETMAGFVTLFPQLEFKDIQREVVFVMDRSGSMGGKKMEQARDTLKLFLRALPPSCTFNIVGFGSQFAALWNTPKPYNDGTLEAATNYAMTMRADFGGTEIKAPLEHIFRRKPPFGTERQVFVLTDGQVSNDLQVFDVIRQHCSKNAKNRLFSVGLGAGVSRYLVEGMARVGRGTSRFVEEGAADSLRAKVLGQLKQALQPSLDNVAIEWKFSPNTKTSSLLGTFSTELPPVKTLLGYRSPTVDEGSSGDFKPRIFPSNIPPVFNQEKFLSFALFPSGCSIPESVSVTCQTSDGPLSVTLPISEDEIYRGSIAHKMAARAGISEYEDNRKSRCSRSPNQQNTLSEGEALQLALTYSLASDQTSFIAVRESPVLEAGTQSIIKKTIPQLLDEPPALRRPFFDAPGSWASPQMGFDLSCCYKMSASYDMPSAPLGSALQGPPAPPTPYCGGGGGGRYGGRGGRGKGGGAPYIYGGLASRGFACSQPSSAPPAPQQMNANSCEANQVSTVKADELTHSDDKVLNLCLLQKANGSFAFDDKLAQAVGVDRGWLHNMAMQLRGQQDVIFATAVAVGALRVQFGKQKSIWELQETKAIQFLRQSGLSELEINTLLTNIEEWLIAVAKK